MTDRVTGASRPVPAEPEGTGFYSWYVVAILLLMNIFAWLDRQIIVLLIDPIRADLGITEVQIGLLTGFAFAILHAVCSFPLGWAADRLSRRWIVFWGVMGWSFATVTCGLARNFWQLFLGRIGVGIGEAAIAPTAYSIVADTFPPQRLGFANSILSSGNAIGLGLSFAIGGFIASAVSHGQLIEVPLLGAMRAWQVAFIVVGVPGMLVAFLIFTIREPRRTNSIRSLSSTAAQDPLQFIAYLRKYWAYYSSTIGAMSVMGIAIYAMMTWAPAYLLRVFSWSGAEVGSATGIVYLTGMIISFLIGGSTVDFLYRRGMKDAAPRLYAYGSLVAGPVAVLGVAAHNAWVFLVALFVWLLLVVSNSANCIAAMQSVTPNEFRGRLVSIYLFTVTMLGLGLGPLMVASLTQYVFQDDRMVGWSLAIVILCVSPLAAALYWNAARCMRKILSERGQA